MLAGIVRLSLGVALGLAPSCALDDGQAADPATADDSTTVDGEEAGSMAVCTTGPIRCHAHVRTFGAERRMAPRAAGPMAAAPIGYGPPDLQAAYKIDPTRIATTAKPTVAIVDAYGYPKLEADLAAYRLQYGLPACTVASGCLKIVNQQGQTTPLPAAPPTGDDWTIETALDVDMASAACPKCKIMVVQATDNAGNGLYNAQNAAAAAGATVISNSWGGPEQGSVATSEPFFNHPAVAIFVAAGDNGYDDAGQGPDYPGTSTFTIAVGGTHLVKSATARGWSETAWTLGGSACSLSVTKPAYQTASPCTFKATTDIAAVGDPASGLAIYNAKNGGWITVGGTSASSPFVAAIMAAGGNGSKTTGQFFAQNAAKLNDVVAGSNGTCAADGALLCTAAVGWDGPTGFGTPNATMLSSNIITGTGSGSGSGSGGDNGGTSAGAGTGDVEGGCSTGGGGAGLVLAVAVVAVGRRRRR
ncbi:MAG TPA: S53 family peptidase [Kofleriaceae bacterium]|nr:S53 family peptidase [Kofleriaceae bacterium]